ncbi:MAG: carbon monoxide dehydrogenase [Lentisphaerae bacterium RIFOXYC12_FULL_60_16]|nr:MAG: carbon monoxide dehydrogenase [Lentisphaerae bacterium RIFOXYC12_FULL_60_16]OGV74570.1 MAG: carbon monoxide dehydrogenase [Lentisphaerae bacterium RIFOXYA12_FULL_60_10]OGV84765.1 MAG: carbon monoxide dehydrogenase [Lentisphaerae bacterium RIFOXYB12_FULL_60_10]
MKLAVTGKGGVGKTTVSALLARTLAARGRKVIAIDADPDSNLAACLGHPHPETVRPLIEWRELIEERTGVSPGTTGGMFRLNPFVADIPERYAVDVGGIKLLVVGAVKKGGSGCYCPENTLLRALISHLFMDAETALVLDMEAGIEHLSRGTLGSVDRLLMVVEPGRRSVETALRIQTMAFDIGLRQIGVVGNKVRSGQDADYLKEALPGLDFLGLLPFDDRIRAAEAAGRSAWGSSTEMERAVETLVDVLENTPKGKSGSDGPDDIRGKRE